MKHALVELVFMMGILKLPIAALVGLLWYAIRAEPDPLEGVALQPEPKPAPHPCSWRPVARGPRRPRPGSQPRRGRRRTRMSA